MSKKMMKILIVLLILITMACTTMYKLELMSDENKKQSINTQYPNYVNMLVRVTNGKITIKDSEGNDIPDFSNPKYYVTGLEKKTGTATIDVVDIANGNLRDTIIINCVI